MNKFFTVLTFLLLLHFAGQATIRYVKPTATGSGNGSSWANASSDLQVMINASAAGDQVWVMVGTYKPNEDFLNTPNNPYNKAFYLNKNIQLFGGFVGNEVAIGQRVAGNTSTLSGDIGIAGDDSDNCYHVMITADLTNAAIIDGFTFSDAHAKASDDHWHSNWSNHDYYLRFGGGMYNNNSSPTISNCTFRDNIARFGGNMMNWYSSPIISNCEFADGTATSGSGIYNYYSPSIISNCRFIGNSATANGGGILNDHSTANISNCTFSGNSVTGRGGGVYNNIATPQISNCTFSGNSASNGGGLYNNNSTPFISDCNFSGNLASNGGGGMCNSLSSPAIINCTFSGNLAPDAPGAGIANVKCSSSTIISNCSFTGNSGGSGSGIFNDSSAIIINKSTFSGNSATNSGGGLYNKNLAININTCSFWNNSATNYGAGMFNYSDSSIIFNCTFWNNSATNYGGGVFNYNSSSSIDHCSFTNNSAALGGGMFNHNADTVSPTIKNCILWENGSSNFFDNNYFSTVTYSDIQGSSIVNGTGNINSDPLFVNAANLNGPDGIPRTPDDGLVLLAGSPAYHTGTATGIQTDILGTIRNNPPSMGAYEIVHFKKIYVNKAATGNNNGSSWANAFTNLQTALNIANVVDTIWIAAGTYIPTATLSLKNGLAIIGGFAGNETQLSQRNFAANPTIISGNNSRQVFNNANVNSTAVLDGCIISNGNSTTNGAGMYNSYSSPSIQNCVFKDNVCNSTANEGGGGMFNYYSNPAITNCVFANNTVNNSLSGGGMSNDNANPIINNCIFSENVVNDYGQGGGMFNFFSNPIINNSLFTKNSVPLNDGGGILNWSSNPVMTNTIIYGNTASTNPNISDISGGATITYSNIEGGYTGTGNINADPMFVNTSSPAGADGKWMTADDGLALMPCSPAVNAGTATTPALPVDILGNGRVAVYDMGAYEYQGNASGLAPGLGSQYASSTKTQSTTTVYSLCGNSHLIATVRQNGSNPIRNTVTAKVWVDNTQNVQFVKRHYEITPADQPSNYGGTVTLYFMQREFDAFNAVNTLKLPTGPSDVTGKANLLIEKRGGVSSDGSGNPGTYPGSITTIDPNDNNIIWDATNSRWEVTFDVAGFSGFWVKTQSVVLPVTLISFSGIKTGNTNKLTWQVANEINLSKYELESSKDAGTFTTIYTEAAQNKATYSYVDDNAARNRNRINYYRLKMIDADGTVKYSNIVALLNNLQGIEIVSLAPNPVKDKTILNVTSAGISKMHINILDAAGRNVSTNEYGLTVGSNQLEMNLENLSSGMYYLQAITTDGPGKTIRFVKE